MFSMFDELKQSQEIDYGYIKMWSTLKNNKTLKK